MSKTIWGVVILLVIVLIVGGYYMSAGKDSTQTSQTSQQTTSNAGSNSAAVETTNVNTNPNTVTPSTAVTTRTINVDASRFQYSPSVIQIKQGEHVKIVVNDLDTSHGISIPAFGVNSLGSVEFTADKVGTFPFHCPTYCGSGHREMAGTIVVSA